MAIKQQSTVTRRQVLLGMGVATIGAAAPWLWARHSVGRGTGTALFFSAFDDDNGQHHLAVLNGSGQLLLRQPVAERAHSVCLSPDASQAIFFARRPGRTAWQIDLSSRRLVRTLHTPAGRHFYGHGCFSPDGRSLYTTENDTRTGRGVITQWALASGHIAQEFDSGGIGPHDLRMDSRGKTLIVANGGLLTHPDKGREPLNIATMQPNLAYLNRADGDVLETISPPNHQLSMRHLWVTPDDQVAVAMQYQGPVTDAVPLLAFHRRGQPLRTALAPLATQRQMRGYTASVCVDPVSRVAAVTCPHGGLVTLWDATTAKFLRALAVSDAGGVNLSADGPGFWLSTGLGQIKRLRVDGRSSNLTSLDNLHWDNHLVSAAG